MKSGQSSRQKNEKKKRNTRSITSKYSWKDVLAHMLATPKFDDAKFRRINGLN